MSDLPGAGDFARAAPYLRDPLVLVAWALVIAAGVAKVVATHILRTHRTSQRVVRQILWPIYGLAVIGIVVALVDLSDKHTEAMARIAVAVNQNGQPVAIATDRSFSAELNGATNRVAVAARAYFSAGAAALRGGNYRLAAQNFAQSWKAAPTAAAHLNEGVALLTLSDYKAALPTLLQGLGIARANRERDLEAALLNNIAVVYLAQGRLPEASDAAKEALSGAIVVNDTSARGTALATLGQIAGQRGAVDSALLLQRSALTLFTAIRDADGQGMCWDNIGETLLDAGRSREAQQAHLTALDRYTEADDVLGQALSQNGIGNALADQGDLARAGVAYHAARSAARGIGNRVLEAKVRNNEAELLRVQGQLDSAHAIAEVALPLARDAGVPDVEAVVLTTIGNVEMGQGHIAAAEHTYTQAAQLHEASGDVLGQARVLGNLAEAYRLNKEFSPAVMNATEAAALFHRIGNSRGEATSRISVGNSWMDRSRAAAALPNYEWAAHATAAAGARDIHGLAMDGLAHAYLAMHNANAARAAGQAALGDFTSIGESPVFVGDAWYVIGVAEIQLNEALDAAAALRSARACLIKGHADAAALDSVNLALAHIRLAPARGPTQVACTGSRAGK